MLHVGEGGWRECVEVHLFWHWPDLSLWLQKIYYDFGLLGLIHNNCIIILNPLDDTTGTILVLNSQSGQTPYIMHSVDLEVWSKNSYT